MVVSFGKCLRYIFRIFLWLILTPLLLFLLTALLLCLPSVQNKAVDWTAAYLSDKTGFDISVGHFGIILPLNISLDDVLALDSKADTILSVDNVILSINFNSLRDKVIDIDAFAMDGVVLNTAGLIDGVCVYGSFGSFYIEADSALTFREGLNTVIDEARLENADINIVLSDVEIPEDDSVSAPLDWIIGFRDVSLDNVGVSIMPLDIDAHVSRLDVGGKIDLGKSLYLIDGLRLSDGDIAVSDLDFVISELDVKTVIDSSVIDVLDVHIDAVEPFMQSAVVADAVASMNLDSMLLRFDVDVAALEASLKASGWYDIDRSSYMADADIRNLFLGKSFGLGDECMIDGHIKASGQGFDFMSDKTRATLSAKIDNCCYGPVNLKKTDVSATLASSVVNGGVSLTAQYNDTSFNASANGDISFKLTHFNSTRPYFDVSASLKDVSLADKSDTLLNTDILSLYAMSGQDTTSLRVGLPGIGINSGASCHIMPLTSQIQKLADAVMTQIDARSIKPDRLKPYFPDLSLNVSIDSINPFAGIYQDMGLGFESVNLDVQTSSNSGLSVKSGISRLTYDTLAVKRLALSISQEDTVTNFNISAECDRQYYIPDFIASVNAAVGPHKSTAQVSLASDIIKGTIPVDDVSGSVLLDAILNLRDSLLDAAGTLSINDLVYQDILFGDRDIELELHPSEGGDYHASAIVRDFPLDIVEGALAVDGMTVGGTIDCKVAADGNIDSIALSAEVLPENARVILPAYGVDMTLGNVPIRYLGNKVILDSVPVYSLDSTFVVADGTVDVNESAFDITVRSERFKPLALAGNDSIPVTGNFEASLDIHAAGQFDNPEIHGRVGVLPATELTLSLDEGNNVRLKASGSLDIDMMPGGEPAVKGRLSVIDGEVRYSFQYYPLLPFTISDESYVEFDGNVTEPYINIIATQPAKANVKSEGKNTRQVHFIVGLKISGTPDNLGLDFILKALNDNVIKDEIATFSQEEINTIAAALLVTGMYISDRNEAAYTSGYALSSILQSRINAFSANRHKDGAFNVDVGIGEATHAGMTGTDYSMKLSKSFFDDRLQFVVGGRVSDNKTMNKSTTLSSFIDDLSLTWQARQGGNTYLKLFHKNSYDNIVDGELQKDGVGVIYEKEWRQYGDYGGTLSSLIEGNFSHRSNSQIGPDLSLTISRSNRLGLGEILSANVSGGYYWNYKTNSVNGRGSVDSYHIGTDVSLSIPRIVVPWKVAENSLSSTSTVFDIGFMHENVAGGYKMYKLSADVSYQFRTSKYTTHIFSPFFLSVVMSNSDNAAESIFMKVLKDKSLVRSLVRDEYVPSMQYQFIYNNTSDTHRSVTTRFDATVKESGNLIGGLQAICGSDFNRKYKKFGFDPYSQFVKFKLELRNVFRLTEKTNLATRIYAGSTISYGNSEYAPLSESFYSGGPVSIRAFASRSIGPGNYHSTDDDDPYFFHGGETRLEMNAEYRFPLVWKFEGALFVDAGNSWNNRSIRDDLSLEEQMLFDEVLRQWNISPDFDGKLRFENLLRETALGTGFGVRLVVQPLVVRFDLGVALHAPYTTEHNGFYNIGNMWKNGLRLNFAIGYPF